MDKLPSMHSSFQEPYDKLESQRKKILDSVRHLTEQQLNKPSAPGKWSIAEILSHIITAERMSLLYIRKKMQGAAEAADSGLWEEVKINLLKISRRFPGLKFKAPRRIVEGTTVYHDLPTLVREWDNVSNEFKLLLEKIPAQYVNRKIFRHVRAGYLSVRHALLFLREHIIHHTPQIKKLVNQK